MATFRRRGRSDSPWVLFGIGVVVAAVLLARRWWRSASWRVAEGPLYMPGEVLLTFATPRLVSSDDRRIADLIASASRLAGVTLQPIQAEGSPRPAGIQQYARRGDDTQARGQTPAGAAQPPLTVRTSIRASGRTAFNRDPVRRAVGRINKGLGALREADISLSSAMPNWILNGGSGGSARPQGGPGTIPDPAPDAAWIINPPPGVAWQPGGPGIAEAGAQSVDEQVIVAVLDTSPGPEALLLAATRFPNNWLLQRLTAGGTDPNAVIAEWNTFAAPSDVPSRTTNSEVDHGLFICGIIHNLAPRAGIHLLHVLDDNGRGRTDLLLAALHHCLDLAQQGRRVVVNLSLYLLIPPGDELWRRWFGPYERILGTDPAAMAGLLDSLDAAVGTAIALLLDAGAVVVAAAGNDALIYGYPPQPRLPADYPGVLCVVATDKHGRRAAYSNEGDIPAMGNCVAAYGGQGEMVDRMVGATPKGKIAVVPPGADPRDGMVGVFCSHHFKTADGPQPNASGWAYWSGTSFATPLVSALAATILAQNELDRQSNPSIATLTPAAVVQLIVGMGTPPSDATLFCPVLPFTQTSA